VNRSATLAKQASIDACDLSSLDEAFISPVMALGAIRSLRSPRRPVASAEADAAPAICSGPENCGLVGVDRRTERERLIDALNQAGWVQAKAARLLNMTPRQIGYALQKHNIKLKKF
jgi:Nif-specific regulatory protein